MTYKIQTVIGTFVETESLEEALRVHTELKSDGIYSEVLDDQDQPVAVIQVDEEQQNRQQ